jgi:hypothetical protein
VEINMASTPESTGSAGSSTPSRHDIAYLEQITRKGAWEEVQFAVAHDEVRYEKLVRAFVSRSYVPNLEADGQPCIQQEANLLDVGRNFGRLATRSDRNSRSQTRFGCFQFLLWISYIAFLEWKGISKKEVDDSMSQLCNFDQRRKRRLLLRAKKINAIIYEIACARHLDIYRATEFFFLCKC